MISHIKKLIPPFALQWYHLVLAMSAAVLYRFPSKKLIVIGVTGTNGKSSTVALIAKILEAAGHRVGATSTVSFKIGGKEWLNDKKMTMLGRFALQKMLRQMVDAGCQYAVIETSSQGIAQYRHVGIEYDVAVFTNLTPEHIEAHGGFENYKKAKQVLFASLTRHQHKVIAGKKQDKIIVANGDDKYASDFTKFPADKKILFGINTTEEKVVAHDLNFTKSGIEFSVDSIKFNLQLFGRFNIYNALAAIAVTEALGVSLDSAKMALESVVVVPGRMEMIDAGQLFSVIVDYAPEPESLRQAYQTLCDHGFINQDNRLIHVLGSAGGGRDVARRPILGKMAGDTAYYVIVTNEDPYDDDPQAIIDNVAQGALEAGKVLDQNLFKIIDRRQAIVKALSLAQAGDVVLLTGKGSEQAICLADGKTVPWDERKIAREELQKLST